MRSFFSFFKLTVIIKLIIPPILDDFSGDELRVTIWESCFNRFNDAELLAMQPIPVLLIAGVNSKIFQGIRLMFM